MKAVKRFDPERGVRLVSFAVHWIRAEIHEFILRNWRIVKVATTKAQRKLFFNLRSLKPGLGTLGSSEVKAIAKELGVKAEEVVEMETRLSGQDVALEPLAEDDENSFAPIAYLAADERGTGGKCSRKRRPRRRSAGLREGARHAGRAQPPHHRSPLAERGAILDAAPTGRRIRRLGRAYPPDREQGAHEDEGLIALRLTASCKASRRPGASGFLFRVRLRPLRQQSPDIVKERCAPAPYDAKSRRRPRGSRRKCRRSDRRCSFRRLRLLLEVHLEFLRRPRDLLRVAVEPEEARIERRHVLAAAPRACRARGRR